MENKYKAIVTFHNDEIVEVYGDNANMITFEICYKYDYQDIKELYIVRTDLLDDEDNNHLKRSR